MTSYRANPQLALDVQNSQITSQGSADPIAYTTYITNQPEIFVTEFQVETNPGNFNAVGLGDFTNPQPYLNLTVAYISSGTVYINGSSVGPLTPEPWDQYQGQHTITLAVDWQNSLFWYSLDQGYWNNNVSADPATGTGGFDFSSVGLSQFCFATQFTNGGDNVTISPYISKPVQNSIELLFRIPFSIVYSDNNSAYVQIVNDGYARDVVLLENAQQVTAIQPTLNIFEYQFVEGNTYQLVWPDNRYSEIFAITPPTIVLNILSAANSSITFSFKDTVVPDTSYNLTVNGTFYISYSETGIYTINYGFPPGSVVSLQINRTDLLSNYYISPVIQVTIEQNLVLTGLTDTSVQLILNPTSTCTGPYFDLYQNGTYIRTIANTGVPVPVTISGLTPNTSYTFYYIAGHGYEISSPLYITTPSVPPTQKLNFSTTWFFSP